MRRQVMKMHWLVAILFLFHLPVNAIAGWEVSSPQSAVPREPFFQAGTKRTFQSPRANAAPMATNTALAPDPLLPRHPLYTPKAVKPIHHKKTLGYKRVPFQDPYAQLGQPAAMYAVSISGSLKDNIERIMGRYHWKVIWKASYDYNFDGRVTGSSLQNVVEKILQPFPLQAVMYMSNRTIAVVPRM